MVRRGIFLVHALLGSVVFGQDTSSTGSNNSTSASTSNVTNSSSNSATASYIEALNDQNAITGNKGCFSLTSSAICTNEFSKMTLPVIEFNGRAIDSSEKFDLTLRSYFGSTAYSKLLESKFGCKGLTNNQLDATLESARNAFVCRELYDSLGAITCDAGQPPPPSICRDSCLGYVNAWHSHAVNVGFCSNLTAVEQKLSEFKIMCTAAPFNGAPGSGSGCIQVHQIPTNCELKTGNPKTACKYCMKYPYDPCCLKSEIQDQCILKELSRASKASKTAMIVLWIVLVLLILMFGALVWLARRRYRPKENKDLNNSFNNLSMSLSTKTARTPIKELQASLECSGTVDNNLLDNVAEKGATKELQTKKSALHDTEANKNGGIINSSGETGNSNTFGLFYLDQPNRSSEINFASILKSVQPKNIDSAKGTKVFENSSSTVKSAPDATTRQSFEGLQHFKLDVSSEGASTPKHLHSSPSDAVAAKNMTSSNNIKLPSKDAKHVKNTGSDIGGKLASEIKINGADGNGQELSKLQRKSNFIENKFTSFTPISTTRKISAVSKLDFEHPFLTTRVQSAQNSPLFTELRDKYLSTKSNTNTGMKTPVQTAASIKSEKTTSVSTSSQVSSYISTSYEHFENRYMYAMYSYTPKEYDELELKPGNVVKVIKVFSDGWALVELHDIMKAGAVPLVCLDDRHILDQPPS